MILKKLRAHVSLFFIYASIVVLPFFFNNCGQRAFYARQTFETVTKLENELIKTYGSSLSAAMCAASEKYVCQHKIFGNDLKDSEADAQLKCVDVGGVEICVSGKVYTYSTAAAQARCQEGCNENYNYEEYFCTFDLATVDGIRPLQATADSLEDSIKQAYAACARVGAAAQGVE